MHSSYGHLTNEKENDHNDGTCAGKQFSGNEKYTKIITSKLEQLRGRNGIFYICSAHWKMHQTRAPIKSAPRVHMEALNMSFAAIIVQFPYDGANLQTP